MTADLASLQFEQKIAGFEAKAVYRNALDKPMGGRFVHLKSGFTLDLIEIQSVPQGFLSVKTFPTSNMGEPHTQEHLLLGKGNVGRALAAKDAMSLVTSTAYTAQLETCYPFSTSAGLDVFFTTLERQLHAFLFPDYTDEEIRREVRNFGVKSAAGGQLELEEKGTIYAEMVSATTQPGYRAYRALGRLVFGPEHPMAFDSGGDPKYIREMKPHHIREFHQANYYLGNMQLIASLPKGPATNSLETTLQRFDKLLSRLQGEKPRVSGRRLADLPAPRGAAPGTIQIVSFPSKNPQQPAPASFAWPVQKELSPLDSALAEVFAEAVGGDPSTNFYKLFIDSKTRRLDTGARTVSMGIDNEAYAQFSVYIPDLAAPNANETRLQEIRQIIQEELARIAAWPDSSPELDDFHRRMEANLTRTKRSLDKLTSSPPRFGARSTGSLWPNLIRELEQQPGFSKSVVQKELIAEVEALLKSRQNIWRDKLAAWKLLSVSPYAVAAKADPDLITQEESEYKQRLNAEAQRLQEQYGVADAQEAIRRYARDYDQASADLDRAAASTPAEKFLDNPPLGLDEQLDASVEKLAGQIPLVTGKFEGMNSATVGLALNVREWQGRQLVYAAILPALLTGSGVTKDGARLSYEESMQRMRREILSLNASYSTNVVTGRAELVLSAAGNNLAETRAALSWLRAALFAPRWDSENLPRLRDQVDQTLSTLRTTMQRSEETWVNDPASAWTYQADSLYLSVSSFLTRLHHLLRLRWLLIDPADDAAKSAVLGFLAQAAKLEPLSVESLNTAAEAANHPLAREAAKDLAFLLPDLPAASRAADWKALLSQIEKDFLTPASEALAELNAARTLILKKSNARLFLTASPESAAALRPDLEQLAASLDDRPRAASAPRAARTIAARVMSRQQLNQEPAFVALPAPNMQGGVFLHSAPFVKLRDLDQESALRFLASKLYAGGGPHGVFMKTWGAGLAYSNGLRSAAGEGRIAYYAERTPELPQTLRFVIGELQKAPRDLPLAEYALAQVFNQTRADSNFESRTAALAEDLTDGNTPEVIRAFRQSILKLRRLPDLDQELHTRMHDAYSLVLPGYRKGAPAPAGGTFLVIGPEKQLAAWQSYLAAAIEPAANLVPLAPRDFWLELP
jgi:Zn-dependent M16 (insulinase) family peptidase